LLLLYNLYEAFILAIYVFEYIIQDFFKLTLIPLIVCRKEYFQIIFCATAGKLRSGRF